MCHYTAVIYWGWAFVSFLISLPCGYRNNVWCKMIFVTLRGVYRPPYFWAAFDDTRSIVLIIVEWSVKCAFVCSHSFVSWPKSLNQVFGRVDRMVSKENTHFSKMSETYLFPIDAVLLVGRSQHGSTSSVSKITLSAQLFQKCRSCLEIVQVP